MLGPLDWCLASSDHSSAPEIATLTLRSAEAGISKTSPVDADRFSAEYGERHLRKAVAEYTEHYHVERNHQRLDNELIDDQRGTINKNGDIERRERLGGIMNYYFRRAA